MRRQKLIVSLTIIFILYLTVIFSSAEQPRESRITNRPLKDLYSKKNYFPLQQQYVPGEIIIKFKMPISDFEIANLFGEYQSQKIGDWRSSWPSTRRMLNGSYVIRLLENGSEEQMDKVFEQNPYVEYTEPNGIAYITTYRSAQRILNSPWEPGKLRPIKAIQGEDLPAGIESTHRADRTSQFSETLNKEIMLHKNAGGETGQVLTASNSGRMAVNKDNGIQSYPESTDNKKETQSFDNKLILRSKTKIYTYRDSEGRLVVTNYCRYKNKTNKK